MDYKDKSFTTRVALLESHLGLRSVMNVQALQRLVLRSPTHRGQYDNPSFNPFPESENTLFNNTDWERNGYGEEFSPARPSSRPLSLALELYVYPGLLSLVGGQTRHVRRRLAVKIFNNKQDLFASLSRESSRRAGPSPRHLPPKYMISR